MAKESQALCQLRELKAPKWNFTTLSPSTLLGEPPHKTKHPSPTKKKRKEKEKKKNCQSGGRAEKQNEGARRPAGRRLFGGGLRDGRVPPNTRCLVASLP